MLLGYVSWQLTKKNPQVQININLLEPTSLQSFSDSFCEGEVTWSSIWLTLNTRGKQNREKFYIQTADSNGARNAGLPHTRPNRAAYPAAIICRVSPAESEESDGDGVSRGREACFIISLPTDVRSALLLFQYVSCRDWKFTARNRKRRRRRSGVEGGWNGEGKGEMKGGMIWEQGFLSVSLGKF